MPCKLCKQFYEKYPLTKDGNNKEFVHKMHGYSMSPISCYFDDAEKNWNCQTIGLIRDICYEGQDLPKGIDYQYCEDMKYATIKIDEVMVDEDYIGEALWVSWYKNRGKTEALWILNYSSPPRKPTEKELLAIANYYKEINNGS